MNYQQSCKLHFTQKYLTEVKIFQNVLGATFLKHPVLVRFCFWSPVFITHYYNFLMNKDIYYDVCCHGNIAVAMATLRGNGYDYRYESFRMNV